MEATVAIVEGNVLRAQVLLYIRNCDGARRKFKPTLRIIFIISGVSVRQVAVQNTRRLLSKEAPSSNPEDWKLSVMEKPRGCHLSDAGGALRQQAPPHG